MYFQLFIFSLSCFALFTLSRLGLVLWQVARMRHSKGWLPVFLGGLRIDAHLIAACSAPVWLIAPWLDGSFLAQYITAFYFSLIWLIAVLLELSTPQFVLEYDTRPNRLYVQYLKHPREVGGMLWKGYKGVVLSTCLLVAATTYGALQLLAPPFPALFTGSLWLAPLLSLVSAVLLFGIIRGTLRHRPINRSAIPMQT